MSTGARERGEIHFIFCLSNEMMTSKPDPTDPSSFSSRYVTVERNGLSYFLIDQKPLHHLGRIEEAPTLLLLHGFPDLWFGYRYRESLISSNRLLSSKSVTDNITATEIHEFAARGWRVIVPSQVGYMHNAPVDLKQYSYKSIAYDLNTILDECNVKGQVIVIGHDWSVYHSTTMIAYPLLMKYATGEE